jgi:hypothetical protein
VEKLKDSSGRGINAKVWRVRRDLGKSETGWIAIFHPKVQWLANSSTPEDKGFIILSYNVIIP